MKLNHKNYNNSHFCLVCGYDIRKEKECYPEVDTILGYNNEYCPCCSVQIDYTYDTETGAGAKEFRKYWAEELNYAFDDEDLKPKGWNKEMALKQIKDNVPEELQ